jgi:hypothetical protein
VRKETPVRVWVHWYCLAPDGAGLTMADWLEIGRRIRKKRIRKNDFEKIRAVINEHIHDR